MLRRCPSRPAPSAAAYASALPLSPGPIGSYSCFGAASLARPHRQLLFIRRCLSRPAPSAAALASALPLSPGTIGSYSCFGAASLARPHRQLLLLRRCPSRLFEVLRRKHAADICFARDSSTARALSTRCHTLHELHVFEISRYNSHPCTMYTAPPTSCPPPPHLPPPSRTHAGRHNRCVRRASS
jgi:hypothetical protein